MNDAKHPVIIQMKLDENGWYVLDHVYRTLEPDEYTLNILDDITTHIDDLFLRGFERK